MRPNKETLVIYDEFDSMIGSNTCEIKPGRPEGFEFCYKPSKFKQWGSAICFSGTVTNNTIYEFKSIFTHPIIISIPSLRPNGETYQLTGIVDHGGKLNEALEAEMNSLLWNNENLIVLFDTADELEDFNQNWKREGCEQKIITVIKDFSKDHHETLNQLLELQLNNFIVLTTKEGGRGIDYKGRTPAHVIICYKPTSTTECI